VPVPPSFEAALSSDVFRVPYDAKTGLKGGECELDLREGAKVRIVSGTHADDRGGVCGRNREDHFQIRCYHYIGCVKSFRAPMMRLLATWAVDAVIRGSVDVMPVVNVSGGAS
jgi:hypothetical protein